MQGPPSGVLDAFGVEGPAVPLEGGQGESWRAGDLVLKPAGADAEPTLCWLLHDAVPRLRPGSLRVAVPVPASDGAVRVRGWAATRHLPGLHPVGRWHERADVARRLARAFADVDPATLPGRDDPWARADRTAWGEEPGPLDGHPLRRAPIPSGLPPAVVHGDLAGNTLLHPELPPAVLDLSLYARPVEWSVAVLAVDLVAFEEAPIHVLGTISDEPRFPQLLARALLFRMTTDVLLGGEPHPAYSALVPEVLTATG